MIHPVITPRFVPTCSDELLEGLGKLSKDKGVRVMSHMCEARDQVDWVKNTRAGKEDVKIFNQVCMDLSAQRFKQPLFSYSFLFDIPLF